MARKPAAPKKEAPAKAERPEVIADTGIAPLFAINKITYGDNKKAPSSSIFTATSEAERAELLDMKAARELTAEEAAVFGTPAPTEPAPTEPAPTEPAPTEPAPTEPAPTDSDFG